MMHNPLLDSDFLKDLAEQRERTVYARIEMLNMQEEPEEEVFGRVTQGTITIDGNSSVRRSFSLTMIPEKEQYYNNYELGLHRKIRLFIGLKNLVNKNYDDVIWFKQGTFLLSAFNVSQSVNSYSISIQGKDKMCKLNGELGGMIESLTADFGKLTSYERDAKGKLITTIEDIPIKTIIREAVHKYGNEPYQNIILNDLDEVGLELMEYRGSKEKPLYLYINLNTNEVENTTFYGETVVYLDKACTKTVEIQDKDQIKYDNRVNANLGGIFEEPTTVWLKGNTDPYSISRVEYGDTCGYRITDLTYPGELTAKVGDAITSILDKIKNMLGNFEYFYDIDGRFVFQKKKNYIQTPFNGIKNDGLVDRYERIELNKETYRKFLYYVNINGEFKIAGSDNFDPTLVYYQKMDGAYVESPLDSQEVAFYFGDSNLVTSFSNTPALSNLKNDFSIWGSKKSATSDTSIPFHLRYAIDKKPVQYTTSDGLKLFTTQTAEEKKEELEEKYEAKKTPNENGLPEEWWDVHEWAEVYRMRAGAYPTATIGTYCTPVDLKVFDYFKRGSGYSSRPLDWVTRTDDVFYDEATNEVVSIHGICGHTYTYYIELAQDGVGAYIHDPQIPEKVLEDIDDTTFYDGQTEIITNLDWREIIYQMALDYNANCHKDDFMINVYKNNEGLFNDNGTTGYEAYYTDLEGFWRELYHPNPPIAGGADFITFIGEIIKEVEQKKCISNQQMRKLGEDFYQYFTKDVKNDNYKFITIGVDDTEDEREKKEKLIRSFWSLIRSKQYPDDGIQTFYAWDSDEEKYIEGKFEDHVTLTSIPTVYNFRNENTRLYQSSGSTYYKLYHYTEMPYYTKEKEISLYDLKEDKVYYYTKVEDGVTLQNYTDLAWPYSDKFSSGYKYYEYAGYERVTTLYKGVQYYTRTGNNPDDYEYHEAIILDEDTTYYSEDPGLNTTDIRVQAFTPGHTYYTLNAKGDRVPAFTYSRETKYYQNSGFKKVLDLSGLSVNDKFFYVKDGIDRYDNAVKVTVELKPEGGVYFFPIHNSFVHYKRIFSSNVQNGRYYPLTYIYDIIGYNALSSDDKTALLTAVGAVMGKHDEHAQLEILKNTTYRDFPDYVDLAVLDVFAKNAFNAYDTQVQEVEKAYRDEQAAAIAEDRDCLMSETDYQNSLKQLETIYTQKLEYINSEKYATSYQTYLVIRNFEYGKRYFTRVASGLTDSNGEPEYEYIRYNCYKFKSKDALYDSTKYNINTGWSMDIGNDPSKLIFWFDFLDNDSEVCEKYNVKAVGNRPKAVNDEKVKAIYYRETPNVIFVSSDDWEDDSQRKPGYTYVKLGYEKENLFDISARGKTAHEQLEEFLYQHTYCTESISMTTIPVYHLQPNTKISVRDDKSQINGEYIITRLTVPLAYNGTMNISATKAADTIY